MLNATSTILLETKNEIATSTLIANPTTITLLIILVILWVLPWKGYALWKSAKNGDKKWFIALFLLNTFSLLEIIYIFVVNRKKK